MSDLLGGGGPPFRRPSFRGALQMDINNGQLRARAWPKHRKRRRPKEQTEREDHFANIQRAWNYYFDAGQMWMRKATAPTPMLPRDMWTMMVYNRLFSFQLPDGTVLYPMPARLDVEAALDAITQTPGEYLRKTPSGWEGASAEGSGSFYPSNKPTSADLPIELLTASTILSTKTEDYGLFMQRGDATPIGINRRAMRLQTVPSAPWTAIAVIRPTPYMRNALDGYIGLAATDLTGVVGAYIRSQNGSVTTNSGRFTALDATGTFSGGRTCYHSPEWMMRLQRTATSLIAGISLDNGRTWYDETAITISSTINPTHVGLDLSNRGSWQTDLASLSCTFWKVT